MSVPGGEVHARGTGLGIAGQACMLGGWLLGVLGAISNSAVGFSGIAVGVLGMVLSIIAFFFVRARWGALGPAAAWLFIGGIAGGLVAFLAIPGDRFWGKLGAMLFGLGVLALGLCLSQLVASIGLARAGQRGLGGAAAAVQVTVLAIALLSAFAGAELWYVACAAAFAGHVLLLVGFARMRARSSRDAPAA